MSPESLGQASMDETTVQAAMGAAGRDSSKQGQNFDTGQAFLPLPLEAGRRIRDRYLVGRESQVPQREKPMPGVQGQRHEYRLLPTPPNWDDASYGGGN